MHQRRMAHLSRMRKNVVSQGPTIFTEVTNWRRIHHTKSSQHVREPVTWFDIYFVCIYASVYEKKLCVRDQKKTFLSPLQPRLAISNQTFEC